MLQARGTRQPGPVMELCRGAVEAATKEGRRWVQTYTQVHPHIHTKMLSKSNTVHISRSKEERLDPNTAAVHLNKQSPPTLPAEVV